MDTPKKVWEEPQLIVLSRGHPEESVLTGCKYIGAVGIYPTLASQDNCNNDTTTNCGNCHDRSPGGS
jgi:hypothetical protein